MNYRGPLKPFYISVLKTKKNQNKKKRITDFSLNNPNLSRIK